MKKLKSFLGLPWVRHFFPVLLFLLAFLPRAIQPVSRPLVWYLRSAYFVDAVLAGDWGNTVYSEHPGVTLMWPVGFGLKLYWFLSGITPAATSVPPGFEPIDFFGPVPEAEIAVAVASLALPIALSIVAAYFLLRRLLGGAVGTVAAVLLALDPYYLAQSKILQLDAWMATLMLLSALALLLYGREQRFRWLLLSAALGGLALLVKATALFLIPFSGLVLLVYAIRNTEYGIRDTDYGTRITYHVLRIAYSVSRRVLLPLAAWLFLAALLYVVLWPAMWVDPERAYRAVESGLVRHASTAHDTPTFFLGEITLEDPGPLFYGVALLLHTGEAAFTFLVIAAIWLVARLIRRRPPRAWVVYALLVAYAVFFLIQMNLGAKKMPRYVLPALLALDVLAAAGVVAWARGWAGVLAGGRRGAARRRAAQALMALPLLIQAALILPRHPYYGTALNWLAGGAPAAARAILVGEEGEGFAELTADLNARPGAEGLTVAAQLKHVFNQTFQGTTVDIDQRADYLAFHRNYTARDYKVEQWGGLWERYAARTPEREIGFDGVPYAWLYPVLAPDALPERPLQVRLGDRFRLLGYDLRASDAAPGDRVPLVLYWQAVEESSDDLSIFLHLLGPEGELVWQDDGAAAHGTRPTWSWGAGEVIVDPHTLLLPRDLAGGEYQVAVGLYDWRTGERLPVVGEDQDQVVVAVLIVRQPGISPAAAAAWAVGGLFVLSAVVLACKSAGYGPGEAYSPETVAGPVGES